MVARKCHQPVFHRLVFNLEVLQRRGLMCAHRSQQFVFVAVVAGRIETMVGDLVASRVQFVRISAHCRQEQHDFLLMMTNVGAQTQVLRHKYRGRPWRWQVFGREQLVAKYN